MSIALRSSRVITVYDQYGNPLPKVIETVEMRQTSRATSPYKSQIFEKDEMFQSPQKTEPQVDNKIIFSKNIELQKSAPKNRMVDQSVEDTDEQFRLIKKAFKRVNGMLEEGDVGKKTKAFIMMHERKEMVKARKNENKPVIKQIELSESTMKGKWDFHKASLHGIVLIENFRTDAKEYKMGFVHVNEQQSIKSSEKGDSRNFRMYQGLFKQQFGVDYKNQVKVQGFNKPSAGVWQENELTINLDDGKSSGTRVIDPYNQNMIYYALNRRLLGDNGEGMNTTPEIVTNPIFRLRDIFLRRKFTSDDQKDLQFVIQAIRNKWISYEEIDDILRYDMLMEDEDCGITIGNLAAIEKAGIYGGDINYGKCEPPRMSAQDVSRDKKKLEKECKPFKKPGCASKCCGAPTTGNKQRPVTGIRRPQQKNQGETPRAGNSNMPETPRNDKISQNNPNSSPENQNQATSDKRI